ncbi:MAG TPA: hypothetical protein VFP80_15830 [Thermoanaerobaculia bacterium]|nr:hypothetical protein [Thermoanaerobaculia bacterium]
MKHTSKVMAISALALLLSLPAMAQTPEVSTLPITEPTEVGGTILQPGTYLIRVVSPQADRNKVQITNVDRSTIYVTALTVPHQLEPNEKMPDTMYVYYPAGEGRPRALRTWFAPDPASGGGHDIVYEESRARQLARLARQPVVSYHDEQMADLTVVTPEETTVPYVYEPAPVITPAPAVVETTEVTTVTTAPAPALVEPEPVPMASAAPAESEDTAPEMPETASRIPLLALLGVISLVGAVAVRFVRSA